MHHELKIEKRWLDRILAGEKRAEVRINDRDFQVGDTVALNGPDGRAAGCNITHVLSNVPGLEPGFVVLSLYTVWGGPR